MPPSGSRLCCRYIYALYFSVSAFAGLGDGDFYVASPAESLIMVFYLMANIVLQAYILGASVWLAECTVVRDGQHAH